MIRTTAFAVILFATAAHAGRAQSAAKPATDSLAARFTGVWDGRFSSDHAAGGMQLTVSRDTAWKASVEMAHGDQAIPTRVTDVKISGKTITWNQDLMGTTCTVSAVVEGTSMTGDGTCGPMMFKIELQKK
jgi:hypothetical protein